MGCWISVHLVQTSFNKGCSGYSLEEGGNFYRGDKLFKLLRKSHQNKSASFTKRRYPHLSNMKSFLEFPKVLQYFKIDGTMLPAQVACFRDAIISQKSKVYSPHARQSCSVVCFCHILVQTHRNLTLEIFNSLTGMSCQPYPIWIYDFFQLPSGFRCLHIKDTHTVKNICHICYWFQSICCHRWEITPI